MRRQKGLRDLYHDQLEDAKTFASQAHSGIANLEPTLVELSHARARSEDLAANYKPPGRTAMRVFDPSIDSEPPEDHQRKLASGLRVVEGQLLSTARRAVELQERYAKLFDWAREKK